MAANTPSLNAKSPVYQLSDLVANCTDLSECCEVGLSFLLSALKLPAGAIFIHGSPAKQPGLMISQGITETQLTRITQHTGSWTISGADNQSPAPASISEQAHYYYFDTDLEAACCQITHHDQALGYFLAPGKPFTDHQQRLAENLLAIMGLEIWSFHRSELLNRRIENAAHLQDELARLAISADSEKYQRRLITGACSLLESQAALLILEDDERPGWYICKTSTSQASWAIQLQPDPGNDPISGCIRTGQFVSYYGDPVQLDLDPSCPDQPLPAGRSVACAPLCRDDRVFGALVVLNKRAGAYDRSDQALLSAAASQGASGLQTIKQIQQDLLAAAEAETEAARRAMIDEHITLNTLLENLPVGIYIIDSNYNLRLVNQRRARQIGAESRSLAGQICFQALFGRREPCAACLVQRTLLDGQVTKRFERRQNDDAFAEMEIQSFPIHREPGAVNWAIIVETDITEKRHLESILVQSEKLAAVGQLAAGIAHEINNPLTAIIANAQILQRELAPDSDLQESVDLISRAGARAAQVVRNLLDFARKEEFHLGLTNVNETVRKAVELVQHDLLARGVELEMDLDPHIPPLLAAADMLQSVWLNLLLNAIDALDKSPERISVQSRQKRHELLISITDNGRGIAPENLTHIFEPFFTTKAAGRGTGLGLSVSNRIIHQHGGYFLVDSKAGQGSTFTVVLPAG